MGIFRSFRSTVAPFLSRQWPTNLKLLVDPVTGAPTGIESPNANGPHGIWTPVDVTADQVASPTAEMLADTNAVYRLNVAPYTHYFSTGLSLYKYSDTNVQTGTQIVYSPLVITDPNGITVQGTLSVRSLPA